MISVQADNLSNSKELEKEVDADIVNFDAWFQQAGKNDPLTGAEKAILKTWLWWKTHEGAKEKEPEGSSPPT